MKRKTLKAIEEALVCAIDYYDSDGFDTLEQHVSYIEMNKALEEIRLRIFNKEQKNERS